MPAAPHIGAQDGVITSTAYVCALGALGLVANLAAFVLIARVVTPADLGVYNLFVGISAALLVFTFDHSSTALLRFGSEEHVLTGHVGVVLGTLLAVTSACTLLAGGLLLVFSQRLDTYFGGAGNYALPLLLFVVTWPFFQSLRIVLQATGEFRRYSLIPIVRSGVLLAAILGVVSLWRPASADLFVWAYVGSIPAASLLTSRWVPWHTVLPVRFSVAHLTRARPWLITMFLGSVTGYVLMWTDSLVLSVISDATSVGIYAVASRLFYQLSVLPEMLTVVLMPKLVARKTLNDDVWIRHYVDRATRWMVLGAVLLTIGVMGGGYFFIPALFGSEYRSSLLPFVILTASFPFLALSRFLGPVYAAYDLVWPLLAINVGCGAANIVLNLVLIPPMDVHGAAIATSLCYGIQAFCVVAYLVWRLRVTGQGFIFLGLPTVALAVLIVVLDSPVGVLFGTVCALAIWAVLVWRSRPQSDEDRQFIAGVMLPSSFARARRILLRA